MVSAIPGSDKGGGGRGREGGKREQGREDGFSATPVRHLFGPDGKDTDDSEIKAIPGGRRSRRSICERVSHARMFVLRSMARRKRTENGELAPLSQARCDVTPLKLAPASCSMRRQFPFLPSTSPVPRRMTALSGISTGVRGSSERCQRRCPSPVHPSLRRTR